MESQPKRNNRHTSEPNCLTFFIDILGKCFTSGETPALHHCVIEWVRVFKDFKDMSCGVDKYMSP